jgi:hypothetical protein
MAKNGDFLVATDNSGAEGGRSRFQMTCVALQRAQVDRVWRSGFDRNIPFLI